MAYFLKKTRNKKGLYLQIYESYYDPQRKQTAHRSYKPLGYEHELQAHGIENPIEYYKQEIAQLNQQLKKPQPKADCKAQPRVGKHSPLLKQGFFPLAAINRALGIDQILNILNIHHNFNCDVVQILHDFVYARAVNPSSKRNTYEYLLPQMKQGEIGYSLPQVYKAIEFLGSYSRQIVDAYTQQLIEKQLVDLSTCYFDCTNFYFEIDTEDQLRTKGKSKENRVDPLVSLGILLDKNHLPVAMEVFAGKDSEKPHLRSQIEKTRSCIGFKGRIIQIADKGLNCSENIKAALAKGDGYIFSQSIAQLPEKELSWILDLSKFTHIAGTPGVDGVYIQEVDDYFEHSFIVDGKRKKAEVHEKRVVMFSEHLRRKKLAEIGKQVTKAKAATTGKKMLKTQIGQKAKYIQLDATNAAGEKIKVTTSLNQPQVSKDEAIAGFNMYITSETRMTALEIIHAYRQLWQIEESFRILKHTLDLRPVYLQKPNSIKGHVLICYLALLLTRLLQFNVLDNKYTPDEISRFMQEFILIPRTKNSYANATPLSDLLEDLAAILDIPLFNLNLTRKQVKDIQQAKLYPHPKP